MRVLPEPEAIVLALLVAVGALLDLRTRRLPNWLTLGGLAGALAMAVWHGRFLSAVGGVEMALTVYIPFFMLRGVGGGDVKMMAVVGAFAGAWTWLILFLFTALNGGILAILLIVSKGTVRSTLNNVVFMLEELIHGRNPALQRPELSLDSPHAQSLPHGVSIALGVLSYLVLSRQIQ